MGKLMNEVEIAVLDEVFGIGQWIGEGEKAIPGGARRWGKRKRAYGKGNYANVRFRDHLEGEGDKAWCWFNIEPRDLEADFELWICLTKDNYYLIPKVDIKAWYNDRKPSRKDHRKPIKHQYTVFPRVNEVQYPNVKNLKHQGMNQYRGLKVTVPTPIIDKKEPGRVRIEGRRYEVVLSRSERSGVARDECLKIYGTACMVCGCDFGKRYGKKFDGYIHVHHLQPMADNRDSHVVIPEKHLRPVCPNCHSVLHQRKPPFTLDDAKGMLGDDE